jgi:hypothetical protein
MKMFPPEVPSRRLCPRHKVIVVKPNPVELDVSLVPLEQGPAIRTVAPYLGGFVPRIAPLTQAEREAVLAKAQQGGSK